MASPPPPAAMNGRGIAFQRSKRAFLSSLMGLLASACATSRSSKLIRGSSSIVVTRREGQDQSKEIQALLEKHRHLCLQGGIYIAGGLILPSDCSLIGLDNAVLQHARGTPYLLSANPGASGNSNPNDNTRNIHLEGLTFRGNAETEGFAEHTHLLNLNACSDLTLTGCRFEGFQGDAIYLGSGNVPGLERHNERVRILNSSFNAWPECSRNGISIIDGQDVTVHGCKFRDCSRQGMPGSIDIEPDEARHHIVRRITIEKNEIEGCRGTVGAICVILPACNFSIPPEEITVRNNVIRGRGRSNGVVAKQYCEGQGTDSAVVTIEGNRIEDTDCPALLSGVSSIEFRQNTIIRSHKPCMLSHPNHGRTGRVRVFGNSLSGVGRHSSTGWILNPCSDLVFRRNRIEAPQDSPGWVALEISDLKDIDRIRQNFFVGLDSGRLARWSSYAAPEGNLEPIRRNNWLHRQAN